MPHFAELSMPATWEIVEKIVTVVLAKRAFNFNVLPFDTGFEFDSKLHLAIIIARGGAAW